MDSLSFDDLIPQQDEAKPAQPEPSVSFDDLVPQTPPVNVSRRRFEERGRRDEEIGSTIGAIGEGISSLWNSWGELTPEEGEAQKRENLERARQQELWAQQQRADIESRMGRDFIPGQTLQESAATEARDIAEGPAPTKTAAKSAAEGFLRETGQGIVSLGTAPGIAIDFVDWAATGDTNESGYTKALRGYSTAIESALPGDPARRGELFDQLAAGGGSMTSMIVGGGALRAAGVPFKAAQYYSGISQGGVSGYEDAEAYSATVGQKYASFFLNAGLGVTEAIPISRAFDRLNDASGGKVQQILANSAANSIEEFIQELGQGIGQNVIANWAAGYDVDRSTTEGVLDQAAVGFILGGIMGGGITAAAPNRPEQVTERGSSEEQTAALKSTAAPAAPTVAPAVDPAITQAVTGTPVQPVAPKRDALLEIARRRDQRAQAPVTPKVTPETTPEAPAGQSQPVDSPNAAGTEPPTAVGVGSAAPPNPTENLRDIGKMGSAAVDGMYTMLWDKVQKGDTRENGVPSAVLEAAKMVRERGGLKTPEEFRKFAGEVGAVDRGNNFQADMRALVDKYTPPAPPAAETPAAPNEEITANVSAAPTEEVPPSRANFYADSPETIKLQHAALRDPKNDRKAVVYSADTPIKDLPDKPQGKFIVRRTFKIDGVSTIVDFNTAKTNYGEVQKAIRTGKLNELLDLGPYNQQEVAESAAAGAAPVAVTERTPDGTEVKSATGTEETAPEQMQALEDTKSEPENTIVVEDPRRVIEERIVGGRRVLEDVSPEGAAKRKAAEEARAKQEAARLAKAQAAAEEAARAAERAAERIKNLEELNTKVEERAFESIEEEALSRAQVGGANLQNQDKEAIVRGAAISKAAFDTGLTAMPDVVASVQDLRQLGTVLNNILTDARTKFVEAQKALKEADKGRKLTTKAKRALGTRTKGDYPTVTGHVIWLSEAASLSRRIDLMGDNKVKINNLLVDVNDFLSNSGSLKEGDDAPLRGKRREKAAEIAASRASDAADERRELGGAQDMEFTESVRDEENATGGRQFEVAADTEAAVDSPDARDLPGEVTPTPAEPVDPRVRWREVRDMRREKAGKAKPKTEAPKAEPVAEEGTTYTTVRATKAPVVETKKKRTLLKRESVGGEESVGSLNDADVLQEVTLADAIAESSEAKGNSVNKSIVNRILARMARNAGDTPVKIVDQSTLDEMFPDRPANAVDGFYDPQKDHIVVSANFLKNGQFDAQLLAHEGLHAYLQRAVDSDPTLKKDIQEILDFARDSAPANLKKAYGFKDVQEFLAEAMSNADFQNLLMSIRLPDALASKYDAPSGSVWQAIVSAVRKHLGLGRKDVDALSYTMRLVERAEARRGGEQDLVRGMRQRGLLSEGRQQNYADELKAAGVPDDVAAELDTFIKEELGKAIDPATLSDLIEDFKAEFGQDTSASNDPMPEEEAKEKAKRAKAETEKEAKRMMRDTTKSREELLDEAYLKALDEFRPGRVPKQNSKALLSLLMNNQLALIADNFFGRSTNPVRRIADLIEKRRTGKQRYVEELGAVAQKLYDLERAYRKKDPEAWENFVSLAHDATMAQVHPDKPLDDEIHKYLGSNKALGGKWSKKQHPRLAAVYNSLPGDLQALYRETRDALTATRDRVELGNVSAVLRKMGFNDEALAKRFLDKKSTEADRKLVGDVVADYIENIVRLSAINGPYFNLARQGDIVLTGRYKVTTPSNAKKIEDGVFEFKSRDEAVKFAEEQMLRPTIARVAVDPKTGERFFVDDDGTQVKATFADPSAEERYRVTVQTKYVEFFHSEAAAREKAEALADAVELNDIEPKRFERSAANADMLSDQMRSLASTLDTRLKSANLTPEQKAILKGTLNEASLRFMASTRLQTHRLPRRYVQGASKDLVVSTYQYVDSSAGYLAKLDTQVELEDAMRQMEKATSALSARREGIGGGARAISNEVERRVNDIDYNMDQGLVAGTANRVMSVNFINHLMSPMYTVLQVVQTPLVAGPVLSAEYGAARTSYHLMKASKDIGALQIGLKGIGATAKGVAGVNTPGRAYTDYAKARLNPLERRALDELIKLGVVDADAGFDVARLERKDSKVVRGVDATLEYFSNIARAAPQSVEAINRAVVGLATFRMEAARGTNFKDAVRKAQEAVELTHFNLSASNAAPIFRNPVGRLLLQFKKYGQNIYFLHYYNAARMLRPKVKGDRAKGAKTLLYLAATHQIAAGLVGLPIEPLKIAVLVLGMIPGMPEWEDLEREAEEALAEMMGKSGAEAMMYGLPRLADVDISSRVGLSSLLLFGEPGEMGDKDSVQSWFLNMLIGPTVGSATDIAGGIAAAAEGEGLKAAEKLLPIKVISDTLRAVREVDDGKFNTQDALMRALGVQSARQARIQQSTGADIDKRSELKREKNAIIKAWISADTASEKAKIIARMREYNKEAGKRDQLSKKFLENIRKKEMKKYEAE